MNINNAILLDVQYDGDKNSIYCKFYDLDNDKIVIWYDNSDYKAYCLSRNIKRGEDDKLSNFYGYYGYSEIEKINPFNDKPENFVKIYGQTPYDILTIRKIVSDTNESYVQFHHNYIYDKELKIGMIYSISNNRLNLLVDGSEKRTGKLNKLYNNPEEYIIRFANEQLFLMDFKIPKPKMLAIDIEVECKDGKVPNPNNPENRIISCSFYSTDGLKLVYILRKIFCDDFLDEVSVPHRFYKTEKRLIQDILKIMKIYPIIITFNGDEFDLPYIKNRGLILGIQEENIPITIKNGKGYMIRTESHLKKGIHIDLFPFFSNKSVRTYAFQSKYERNSLDSISKALLGEGKIEHEENFDEMSYYDLARYNLKDSELTLRLMTYNNYLVWNLIILFCRITKLPISDLTRRGLSAWIRSLCYDEHRKRNYYIPNMEEIQRIKPSSHFNEAIIEGKGYKGAYVFEPEVGIHFNVVVDDFASLYPTVIKEYNLSYETMNCGHNECKEEIIGIPYHTCKKRKGMTSYMVGFFRDIRVSYYKPLSSDKTKTEQERETATTIQQALKVFINGTYGVFGDKSFPLFCLPVAESTTAISYESIKRTSEFAKSIGVHTIYGDTDSLFLDNPTDEQNNRIIEFCKRMDLDFEKEKTYIFVAFSSRKKNYIGIIKPDKKADIKGLAGKKRNTPQFIRNNITEFIELLKNIETMDDFLKYKQKIINFIRNKRNKICKDYELIDYTYNIVLKQPLTSYKVSTQHTKAAELSNKKYEVGDVISYIKTTTKDGVLPIEMADFKYLDSKKYNESFKTAFEQILDAFGITWNDVNGIKKLDNYFNIKPKIKRG